MKKLLLALGILVAVAGVASAEDAGGFGLGAGMVKVKDSDSSQLWLTANVRWMLADNLALEPEIGWYRWTAGTGGDDRVDVFNGGGSALIILPVEKIDLFAGVGLGAHMYRASSSGMSSTETHLGYHGLAGIDLHASRGVSLFGAVRYEIISLGSGLDSVKQFKLYGGLRFRSH
jgi:hypothetical protein